MLKPINQIQHPSFVQQEADLQLLGHWKGTLARWDHVLTRYQELIPCDELTEVIAVIKRLLLPAHPRDALQLLAYLKVAYSNGRNFTDDDAALHVEVYLDAFKKFPLDILDSTVKDLINENKFSLDIAEINEVARPLLKERRALLRIAEEMLETHQRNERILSWTDRIKEILADGPMLKAEVVRQLSGVPRGRRISEEEGKIFDDIEECIRRLLKTEELIAATEEGDRTPWQYIAWTAFIPKETNDESDK